MASVDWERLEREAEQGRQVLVYLNQLELRRQEDREYVEQVKRAESRTKGAAA